MGGKSMFVKRINSLGWLVVAIALFFGLSGFEPIKSIVDPIRDYETFTVVIAALVGAFFGIRKKEPP